MPSGVYKRKDKPKIICKTCGKEFIVYLCRMKNQKPKFCSEKCFGISRKGKPSWNKGKKLHYKTWNKGKKCPQLTGKNNPAWKGGKTKNASGYILILKPEHPFCSKRNYVREHRLIMEKYLGRYLKPEERIHHINGIKTDNRIGNLKLFKNNKEHNKYQWLKIKKWMSESKTTYE